MLTLCKLFWNWYRQCNAESEPIKDLGYEAFECLAGWTGDRVHVQVAFWDNLPHCCKATSYMISIKADCLSFRKHASIGTQELAWQ